MRKRWMRRALLILLAVLMLCALTFPANGASDIYLMAINDMVFEMTAENMPLVSGSTLYVPYTMLSPQDSGINLGVRSHYSASRGILSVTDGSKTVTFDIRRSTAYDNDGNPLDIWALTRNTMAYIPIHWICEYFPSISYSLNRTNYGALVRVTNSSVIIQNDTEFIFAASDNLRRNLERYQSSLDEPEPSPSPSPSPSPTPTVPPSPPPTTAPTPTPVVYLAFRGGEYTTNAADVLESAGLRGLFLFTSGELIRQDDLIRRLVGQGHQVGLALTGSDAESCLAQLSAGRQLLSDIARSSVLIVSADELDSADYQVLREAGCAIWSATLQAGDSNAAALLRQLDPDHANYLQFTCDEQGLSLLTQSLSSLTGSDFRLYRTLASALQIG